MQVLAIDQVSEVSQALSWTMDNIEQYYGNPNSVYLMGHSSGTVKSLVMLVRVSFLVFHSEQAVSHIELQACQNLAYFPCENTWWS